MGRGGISGQVCPEAQHRRAAAEPSRGSLFSTSTTTAHPLTTQGHRRREVRQLERQVRERWALSGGADRRRRFVCWRHPPPPPPSPPRPPGNTTTGHLDRSLQCANSGGREQETGHIRLRQLRQQQQLLRLVRRPLYVVAVSSHLSPGKKSVQHLQQGRRGH